MPIYKGKTAEEWFFGPTGHPGLETTLRSAGVAFKAMGTNCVPFLLEKAKTRETTFNRFYCWLVPKLPVWVQAKVRPAVGANYVQWIAYRYLGELEVGSNFMAEEILASVKLIDDEGTRLRAFESTMALVGRMGEIEKEKAYFLSFLNDSDFQIQLQSAVMLSRLDNKLTNGVPILAMAVTNRNYLATSITSRWAGATVPIAMSQMANIVRYRQKTAYEALQIVSPEMAKQLQPSEK